MGWGEAWDRKEQLASKVEEIDTQTIITELASYLKTLSKEERMHLFDEVEGFIKNTSFSNSCHDDHGKFCEGGAGVIEKVKNFWNKVPEIVKFNMAFAGLSAQLIATEPGLRSMVAAGSPHGLMVLAAGAGIMMYKTVDKYTRN